MNESQTQNMYCLWFITIKYCGGHFVGETLTIYTKLLSLHAQFLFGNFRFKCIPSSNTPKEFTVW